MFSREERIKVIQLFLKNDCSYAAIVQELSYLSFGALHQWYKEYLVSGELYQEHREKATYSGERKQKSVNHYF